MYSPVGSVYVLVEFLDDSVRMVWLVRGSLASSDGEAVNAEGEGVTFGSCASQEGDVGDERTFAVGAERTRSGRVGQGESGGGGGATR